MTKKKRHDDPKTVTKKIHPLKKLPEPSEEEMISEEELDSLPDEEEEETAPPDAPPPPGKGP